MVCSINALEQLQCWEREWWTPGINYNLTMQSHNSKSSSLHLQVESKAYFCAGYLSFSLSYSIIVPKGGVPIFYDFCNNALEPLPPIIGLVLYIFYNWLLFVWNVFYAWSQSKKSLYNIFLDCWTFSDYSNRWLRKNDNFQSHLRCLRWTSDNPNHMNNMFWESRNDSEWSADETPNMTTVINFTFFETPP